MLVAGNGGSPTNWNNLGPRFGLAYDVFGNGKTAVRGGYGIFFDRIGSNIAAYAQNPPFINTVTVYNGNIDNPGGGTAITFPSALSALSSTAKVPSVESYNFGIEQQLPGAMIFGISYVGNILRHLPDTRNLNQVPMGTLLNTTANLNALRPYLGYADINLRDLSNNSNYNSLQTTLNRRFANGLAFGGSYTFSKTMDKVGASATNGGNIGGSTPQDSYNPFAQVALASIDVPHVLSANYIYSLPFFAKSSNAFVSNVLGGWEISGITTAQSGFPYSVTVRVDIGRIGASSSLATVLGNPNLPSDK